MENILDYTGGRTLSSRLPWLAEGFDWLSIAIETVAVGVLLVGTVRFVISFVKGQWRRRSSFAAEALLPARAAFRLYILAGLDLLIVSDIIHTAITLALADLLFLALLVAIRVGVGFTLERTGIGDVPAKLK